MNIFRISLTPIDRLSKQDSAPLPRLEDGVENANRYYPSISLPSRSARSDRQTGGELQSALSHLDSRYNMIVTNETYFYIIAPHARSRNTL